MDEKYDELDELEDFEDEEDEEEEIEAYCVSCKEKVEMLNPIAVWTSQGRPGTRGECPICAGTVFRMGRTHLHGSSKRPSAVQVFDKSKKGGRSAARAAYIAADLTQADFAEKLSQDLRNIGINVWVDDGESVDDTNWAGGVHPALEQCTHLIVVLSGFSQSTSTVEDAWRYFRSQRKPVVVAQVEAVDPPDDLRSRPRYNFQEDYKVAFRGLVEALSR